MKIKYTLENSLEKYKSEFGEISTGILIEKKSKFISYIFNVTTKEQALEYINDIKKRYNDASHVVYIYSIYENDNYILKYSDDGEPSGTGTKAIYEALEKEKITNICIAVVRYFGGTLLGAGPLSRAYYNTYKLALNHTKKIQIYNYINYSAKLSYARYKVIENAINKHVSENNIIVLNIEFTDDVKIDMKIKEEKYSCIIEELKL